MWVSNSYIWENSVLCFGQKIYIDVWVRGRRRGQGLDVGSKFRIEFSICELPLMLKYNLQNADWQDILKQQTPDRAYDLSLNDILTWGISNHWEQN